MHDACILLLYIPCFCFFFPPRVSYHIITLTNLNGLLLNDLHNFQESGNLGLLV